MKVEKTAARVQSGIRAALIGVSFALGALLVVGCIIGVLFEVENFPPRPGPARSWYLVLLTLGLGAGVVGPFLLLRALTPDIDQRRWFRAMLLTLCGSVLLLVVVLSR